MTTSGFSYPDIIQAADEARQVIQRYGVDLSGIVVGILIARGPQSVVDLARWVNVSPITIELGLIPGSAFVEKGPDSRVRLKEHT